jgi:UDPglucose 6-dehydrogenase
MNLTIHGTGYVGLVTKGEIPIYEPGLEAIVLRNIENGRLQFTTDVVEGVAFGLLQFIAVGTPPDEDGSADMQYVLAVAGSIGEHMDEYKVVINKSTVPVGTADQVRDWMAEKLAERGAEIGFDVVSNPEFLKEGAAVSDFMKPNRIVVGTDSARAEELLRQLYEPFNRNRDRLLFLGIRSAELTKYAANAMLATKISFMNELSNMAELLGADIEQVRLGIGSDPRIGYQFIYPGCGFGGSCFPKDVRALAHSASEVGFQAELIESVQHVNDRQKQKLFAKLSKYFGAELAGKTVALWGLAFKPNTDDMREAPSRTFMEACWEIGVAVRAYDPVAHEETRRIYGERDDLTICATAAEALDGADALVIATEWAEFRAPDFELVKSKLTQPVIFDGRNIYDPGQLAQLGIEYYGIGRGLT